MTREQAILKIKHNIGTIAEVTFFINKIYDDFEKEKDKLSHTNTQKLRQWRADRHLSKPNTKVFIENILEELLEICYEDKVMIQNIKDDIMFDYFQVKELSENDTIDAINDIVVFSINEAETMGYDFDNTLSETIREISSRVQDPIQKDIWSKWGYDNTKWKKWSEQPLDTLYKADYLRCKL
jgi:hypothetical protein